MGTGLTEAMEELEAQDFDRSTHFVFEHKVFSVEGSYFSALNDQKSPYFYIPMGEARAAVPLHSLRKEFDLASGSSDSQLLDVVEKSLRFVREIRPYDCIPREVLDGTASWSVQDRHHMIANGRITVQLISWITGEERTVVDLEELQQVVQDPTTKDRLQEAFNEIADKLGIGRENKHKVVDRIGQLVNELSYIEALRDEFKRILTIGHELNNLASVYRSEASVQEEVIRASQLFKVPAKEYADLFGIIDRETREIYPLLEHYETKIDTIRAVRDQAHYKFMIWKNLLEGWANNPSNDTTETVRLIRDTYRFLAQNFTLAVEW